MSYSSSWFLPLDVRAMLLRQRGSNISMQRIDRRGIHGVLRARKRWKALQGVRMYNHSWHFLYSLYYLCQSNLRFNFPCWKFSSLMWFLRFSLVPCPAYASRDNLAPTRHINQHLRVSWPLGELAPPLVDTLVTRHVGHSKEGFWVFMDCMSDITIKHGTPTVLLYF